MPEPGQAPTVENQLAEMDRRLRELQAELAPDVEEAAESEPPPPPAAEPASEPASPPAAEPTPPRAAPAPPPTQPLTAQEIRGREGPLAALLQRSARRELSAQQLEVLADLSDRLLASLRDLLGGYELVFTQMRPGGASPPTSPMTTTLPPRPAQPPELSVSAGPFHSTVALREFQRALSRLPGVRDVAVREYEGADRAVLHVQLDEETA